jgi:iron complex outermembrane receptor protein
MTKTKLAVSAAALAVAQAFPAIAAAQTAEPQIAEVVVTATARTAERASVGGFRRHSAAADTGLDQRDHREQMQDLSIRSTTDAVALRRQVSDAYNAVGYAEQFSIRGFKLDNNYSYRKDGLAIPGDTQIPLENKERIEVLKGLAGLQAGVAAPGGIVNYVTKRPTSTPLRSATFESASAARCTAASTWAAASKTAASATASTPPPTDLRSYVKGADGDRQFVSGAFDWQISPGRCCSWTPTTSTNRRSRRPASS